ncbi:MAG: rod shape-determining protein MreC [Porticoccaceae bacterium]|nr:rod shape-determining protein MreC [Porticoccaceae bacterium]MDG1473991.1 rod shape-determining protein MreC [Porticoccaceae bacterium]
MGISKIFVKASFIARRLLFVVMISFGLMAVNSYTQWFKPINDVFENIILPIHWVANIPARVSRWSSFMVADSADLQMENARLAQENLIHRGQIQRMADLAAENLRLRLLLNATELFLDSVLVTEVIGVSPTPRRHTLVIDRGSQDGAYVGQPLLDAEGLMGQIISVYDNHSIALLITDSSHAIPIQVLRNGLRSIAEGTSDYNRLRLRFISSTADIRAGDSLVSSGLGERFPPGYPVGKVITVTQIPGANFVDVEVEPTAQIDRSKHLLLVFTLGDVGVPGSLQ